MTSIGDILKNVQGYAPDADQGVVMQAYLLAAKAHQGQRRKSGEDYLTHPMAVAEICTGMGMDVDTIATALLHDALEDNPMSKREMTQTVGPVVAELVDGVTKIGKLKYKSQEELQAENFRKMMLAMSQDLRVILVKLADRLHNMRTLDGHKEDKRRKISRETMEVYAPIANRLGLTRIKSELEDLCLRYLHPEAYDDIDAYLRATQADRESYTERVVGVLQAAMDDQGVKATVSGRAKARFSIHKKQVQTGRSLSDMHDLLAFRLVTESVSDCYMALGLVHDAYEPVPDRIKDYIARPKPNGYQSLHTTVVGPEGKRIEVQIRTAEMHRVAEDGIAAHWRYKEGHLALTPDDVLRISKIRDVFEAASEAETAAEFMETVKVEFYAEEVFVFTPTNDVKAFAAGATPLDFAYAIHSDVGDHCVGAKADGRIVPLSYEMQSGQTIEVMTHPSQQPNRDWLDMAKTGRAISKIRRFLRKQEEDSAIKLGANMLKAELGRFQSDLSTVQKAGTLDAMLADRGRTLPQIYVELARGTVTVGDVARALLPDGTWISHQEAKQQNRLQSLLNPFRTQRTQSPVRITGEDGVMVSFAQCCAPLPGEAVRGFITRGRGISVHRTDCTTLAGLEPERQVPVEWELQTKSKHTINLQIGCEDRTGLLAKITGVCDREGVNIEAANASTGVGGPGPDSIVGLQVALQDLSHLTRVIRSLERIDGIVSVRRA